MDLINYLVIHNVPLKIIRYSIFKGKTTILHIKTCEICNYNVFLMRKKFFFHIDEDPK